MARSRLEISTSLLFGLAGLSPLVAHAQVQVQQAVVQFDTAVRDYNAITFGDATFSGQHSDTGVAVGGNLTSSSWDYGQHGGSGSDPTLYVAGGATFNGESHLNSGYATINPAHNSGALSGANFSTSTSSGKLLLNGDKTDPLSNAAPSGWNWTSLQQQMIDISDTLAAATPTGNFSIGGGGQQLIVSSAATSGVVVFDLSASLLTSLGYFSSIKIDVPDNTVFVINVSGFDAGSLFSGKNFEGVSSDDNARILWNIIDSDGNTSNNTLQLGTNDNFYGSILAPTFAISNGNALVNGQIVADSLTYSGKELHYTNFESPPGFSDIPPLPEPATYGWAGLGTLGAVLAWRRRREALRLIRR